MNPMPAKRIGVGRRAFGFSFVELLFAIAVLGIGFIMIAAVFPIGLQQTKLTLDETAAAAAAKAMAASVGNVAQSTVTIGGTKTAIMPGTSAVAPVQAQLTALGVTSHIFPGEVRTFRDPRTFADATGNTAIHNDTFWKILAGNVINASDPRNASVVLFKRDWNAQLKNGVYSVAPTNSAQLIVINTQVANTSAYTNNDVYYPPAGGGGIVFYNLEPRPVGVTIAKNADGAYQATFTAVTNKMGFPTEPELSAAPYTVAEGAFIVISDDRIDTPVTDRGRMNGRIYRVGTRISATEWLLAPGYDFQEDAGADGILADNTNKDDITAIGVKTTGPSSQVTTLNNEPAVAFVLGRGFANPLVTPATSDGYAGPAMDVSIYTTFVSLP